jgi:acyl dehydratase
MSTRPGWRGRLHEDFPARDVHEQPPGRYASQAGNARCTLLTQNTAPVHSGRRYASQTGSGRPLANPASTIALVTGQSVSGIPQNVMAAPGRDEARLPRPPPGGDTVRTTGFSQDGVPVITFRRTVMACRRGRGPPVPRAAP